MSQGQYETLMNTLTTLSERMKWVILIGGALISVLGAGYAYQVNINMSHASAIKSNQAALTSHIQQADLLTEAILNRELNK